MQLTDIELARDVVEGIVHGAVFLDSSKGLTDYRRRHSQGERKVDEPISIRYSSGEFADLTPPHYLGDEQQQPPSSLVTSEAGSMTRAVLAGPFVRSRVSGTTPQELLT